MSAAERACRLCQRTTALSYSSILRLLIPGQKGDEGRNKSYCPPSALHRDSLCSGVFTTRLYRSAPQLQRQQFRMRRHSYLFPLASGICLFPIKLRQNFLPNYPYHIFDQLPVRVIRQVRHPDGLGHRLGTECTEVHRIPLLNPFPLAHLLGDKGTAHAAGSQVKGCLGCTVDG